MAGLTIDSASTAVLTLLGVVAAEGTRPAPAGRLVLALDGRSGAGKTTLAGQVAAAAGRLGPAVVLSMDDVYPGWDGLDAGAERLVSDVLRPLADGGPVGIHRWDWLLDTDGPWQPLDVPARGLLVVEGAGAASLAAAEYLSAVVWVDGDAAVRRERALERDGGTYAPHWERWAAQEDAYAGRERVRERADLVIDALPADPAIRGAGDA